MFVIIILAVAISGGAIVSSCMQDTAQQYEMPLELNFFQHKTPAQSTLSGTVVGGDQNPTPSQTAEICKGQAGEELTYAEAKQIALTSDCVKDGTLKETHFCNENSGTWWIDLNLNKAGCAPACVINVATKTAEINWRCTGLIPQ